MAYNGLTADKADISINPNGFIPKTRTCKGDSEEIFRGSVLTWLEASNKIVAKQAPSTSAFLAPVGIALKGTDSAAGIIDVQTQCLVDSLMVYGSPEVGALAYLRGRKNKLSDNLREHPIPKKLIHGNMVFTNDSATVSGIGTKYKLEIEVGDIIFGEVDGYNYRVPVTAVINDTTLTIAWGYDGTTSDATGETGYSFTPTTRTLTGGTDVVFTNASADVTGTTTKFTEECNVGDWIYIIDAGVENSGIAYMGVIDTITNDTTMTIAEVYTGSTSNATGDATLYLVKHSEVTTEPYELWNSVVYYNLPLGKITNFKDTLWTIDFDPNIAGDLAIGSGSALVSSSLDTAAAGTLTIGGTNATLINFASTGVKSDFAGPIEASENITTDEIDTVTAATLKIGKSTATAIEISDTAINVTIKGPLIASENITSDEIDAATAATLLIGKATAIKVEIADTGVETEIQGSLDVHEDANFVTGVIAGVSENILMGCGQVIVEYTFPWNDVTGTEQAAALAKCYDHGTTAYVNLSLSGGSDEYNVNYQLFPDDEVENDAAYFCGATPYGCIYTDCGSGTPGVYGADSITWEYWDGSAWSALTIIYDQTDTTAQDGLRPFQGDGYTFFSAPTDWASLEVDSQAGYWIRARCNATVNITTIPITNSTEHTLTAADNGTKVPYAGAAGRGRFNFNTTSGENNDTKVLLYNFTSGACSEISTLTKAKKDPTVADFALAVAADDVIGYWIVQEDGTTEYEYGTCELTIARI